MNIIRIKGIKSPDWETKSQLCKRDLKVKKIAFALICLMNLAGIVTFLAFVTMHYPLPSLESLYYLTPFIGGIISALILLKIPTMGVTYVTYRHLTDLPLLLSKILALTFFGPTLVAKNAIDWRDYSDPSVARQIRKDFEKPDNFLEIMEKYGPCIDNLEKYGYLSFEIANEFRNFYSDIKIYIELFRIWQRQNPEIPEKEFIYQNRLEKGKKDWETLREYIHLPQPALQIHKSTCNDCLTSCFNYLENHK